ncbi:hypothetical protein CC86DRAFT_345273 [Ophiobolus disseminans]|uniref:Acyl-CoA N-acyltransferase n=1 Tax=Ophiobolus disseminans TaxID=1469910 RepID=A0A6A7AAK0_9PLEO|nr:hypothetical protein CC86DRAFT_345273 [Ophiobolus disseminans]
MMQSSISSWLKKPAGPQQQEQPPKAPPAGTPALKRLPPPPKSASAPSRVPSATTPAAKAMDNWNDIPEDFLQAPSRPKSKKSPRSSRTVTPASTSRVPTPVSLPAQKPTIPQLFSLRPLPPNVEITSLTEELLPAYRRLNALTLPVAYPESFYKETMTEPHLGITLVAVWHSTATHQSSEDASSDPPRLVGAVRCRLLPSSQLYISTIGILAPYRTHGIAMHLLQAVVRRAVELHSVRSITAHVWEANEEGLEWYKKRSFEILEKEAVYYRKLRPQGAYLTYIITCIGGHCDDGSDPKPTPTPKPSSSSKKPDPPKTSSSSKYTSPPAEPSKTSKSPPKPTLRPTKTQEGEVGPSSTACPVPLYYQCGGYYDGVPWTGCTKCVKGAKCLVQNEWYDQCVADE